MDEEDRKRNIERESVNHTGSPTASDARGHDESSEACCVLNVSLTQRFRCGGTLPIGSGSTRSKPPIGMDAQLSMSRGGSSKSAGPSDGTSAPPVSPSDNQSVSSRFPSAMVVSTAARRTFSMRRAGSPRSTAESKSAPRLGRDAAHGARPDCEATLLSVLLMEYTRCAALEAPLEMPQATGRRGGAPPRMIA